MEIYIYKFLFDKAVEDLHQLGMDSSWYGYKKFPANIAFLNNYSDEINKGYYRLDNIETGEKIPQPPVPEREDYEFIGWFTESECLNLWDFNNEIEIAEDAEFRFYAGWAAL